MTQEMQFKTIVAQYCKFKPEEMTNEMQKHYILADYKNIDLR